MDNRINIKKILNNRKIPLIKRCYGSNQARKRSLRYLQAIHNGFSKRKAFLIAGRVR